MVGIAKLVIAPGCGPGGRGFESHYSPHKKKNEGNSLRFSFYKMNLMIQYPAILFLLDKLGFIGEDANC